jgi:hypothetical protein
MADFGSGFRSVKENNILTQTRSGRESLNEATSRLPLKKVRGALIKPAKRNARFSPWNANRLHFALKLL